MKKLLYILFLSLALGLTSAVLTSVRAADIHKITIDGVINPVSANFIITAVERAETEKADALLIELDTPGGLLQATREIVQSFLAADVPIIVYVSPSGARAGSAGVFITMAAHVAVMAPGTNIGAAHPVNVGGGGMPGVEKDSSGQSVMNEKMTNDAVAMIKSIAETRNRNLDWAEKSVRESASVTANEALDLGVIDFISENDEQLFVDVNEMKVILPEREVILRTDRINITTFELSWQEKIFDYLTDPNIAYILMMIGVYGLFFELSNPGSILPGVVGVISLLLAFYAFQTLPLNLAGILLIIFGIILLLLEIKVTSYGGLTIGGAVALFLGSIMLIETDIPELRISLGVIVPTVILTVVLALFAISMGLRAQSRKITTGRQGLIGTVGEALEDIDKKGQILVAGEYWVAEADRKIEKGSNVKVKRIRGMTLIVEAVSSPDD